MCASWLHCLYRRRFKTRFEICKDEDAGLSDFRAIRRHSNEIIIFSRPMNYVMVHYRKGDTHTLLSNVDQARDQYSIAKAGLVTEEKRA